MPVSIRPIRAEDAPAFLDLTLALDRETEFMMLEPGERTTTVDEQRRRIETLLAADNQMIFVAEDSRGRDRRFSGRVWRRLPPQPRYRPHRHRAARGLDGSGHWRPAVRGDEILGALVGRAPPRADRHVP